MRLPKDILVEQHVLLRLRDDILFGVLDRYYSDRNGKWTLYGIMYRPALESVEKEAKLLPPILEAYPASHNRSYRPKL